MEKTEDINQKLQEEDKGQEIEEEKVKSTGIEDAAQKVSLSSNLMKENLEGLLKQT